MTTLCTNIEAGSLTEKATTQYSGWSFNSLCEFNGVRYGANGNGIYSLNGGTDDGVEISGYFAPVLSDFGDSRPKRLRFLYFGYEATGDLQITVYADEDIIGRAYTLPATKFGQQRVRIAIGRNGSGRYWTIKIANTSGCDFSIDTIDVEYVSRSHGVVRG